jgi:hypothetical protein
LQNKKKSQAESSNESKKKTNSSPQKLNENKKHDKNNSQQISDGKDSNQKLNNNNSLKSGNIILSNNFINNNNHKKSEDINDKPDKKKIDNIQALSKEINSISINLDDSKDNDNNINNNLKKTNKINTINIKINENPKDKIIENNEVSLPSKLTSPLSNDDNFYNQMKENDKKLKESLQAYNNLNKRSDGASLNTLFKLRSILINWLKDSDQDLEYTKFMTEKKIKYLMKNKEKSEIRIKVLDTEIKALNVRKEELEKILGEIYCFYDEEGLKEDIKRFENSNEVKSGKFSKTLEQLETMKKMLPYVSEYGKVKDSKTKKYNEKKELEKIVKSSGQTLVFLSNYYKNIKKKINEQINNI